MFFVSFFMLVIGITLFFCATRNRKRGIPNMPNIPPPPPKKSLLSEQCPVCLQNHPPFIKCDQVTVPCIACEKPLRSYQRWRMRRKGISTYPLCERCALKLDHPDGTWEPA